MTERANASEADASAAAPLIQGTVFSHGTMECRDPIKTQRFLTEFLGLHSVRKSPNTQYVWCGGSWFIVCLNMSDKFKPRQGEDYRFALFVDSERAVQEAHAAAVSEKDKWEMLEVRDVVHSDDKVSFNLRDLNGVWWEIYWGRRLQPRRLYDHIFSNAQ